MGIAALTASRSIQQNHLAVAIKTVARHRRVTMTPMATALDGLAVLAQPDGSMATQAAPRGDDTHAVANLLEQCSALTDPVLHGGDDGIWSPEDRA